MSRPRFVSTAKPGDAHDRAVACWHARDLGRVTIHDYAQRLRTFFRFAEHQGWCAAGLADGIMPSRFHPGETVSKGLTRDEVLRLLATTEGSQPVDVRDRALLMMFIAYGLRAGEVAGGERAAAIYSLIGTAKLNGIDPEAYLSRVLARIADHPVRRVDEFLPWNLAGSLIVGSRPAA